MKDTVNYNNKEYTIVEVYDMKDGKIIQCNSDDDIILFYRNSNGEIRNLNDEEEQEFRKKQHLVNQVYVPSKVKDFINFEFNATAVNSNYEKQFKDNFIKLLSRIDLSLCDSIYLQQRLNKLKYRLNGKMNCYANDTIYLACNNEKEIDNWVITHETVHGIVGESKITTYGIIEGITDMMVGQMLPHGNYSKNIYGGKIQVNDYNLGQAPLASIAKQIAYALENEYNSYEMLINPFEQLKKFSLKYGKDKSRKLMHMINKLYYDSNKDNYMMIQNKILEIIFEKKYLLINDSETAKQYFEDLLNFGLLRGRIDGKDKVLERYYNKKRMLLKFVGIDMKDVPLYYEKEFYPCGDVYFKFNSYINSSIKAKKEGKGESFKIFYNKDNTCVYIVVDGKLSLIRNASYNNKRSFIDNELNDTNCQIKELENGNYLIIGPDGVKEEVRYTNSDEIINNYFDKQENNAKNKK